MEEKLSSKQMILDIASMRSMALKLLKEGKDYNPLLKALTDQDYYYNDDLNVPSLQDLAQTSGLKYNKVRSYLKEIYNDLMLNFGEGKTIKFNSVEYWFSLRAYDKYMVFVTDKLQIIPRVGEGITVPFFRAYIGTDFFYVEQVRHSLEDQKQIVNIFLNNGTYNLYWHFRKDQAEEEGEISIHDKLNMNDLQLKRKLKLGRYRSW
jgi:hypothetical protein